MSLLENVKELVSQRKMTVAELERKLDFSQGSIRHWDKTYPGVDKKTSRLYYKRKVRKTLI